MNSRSITIALKVLATGAALLGLSMLYFVFAQRLPRSMATRDGVGVLICLFDTFFGGYLAFAGFYAWFRFSPHAVRHILTLVFLMLLWTISGKLGRAPHTSPYWFLGIAVSCYLFYRLAYFFCLTQLFPLPTPAAPSLQPR
jgi:hypothetical protein